MSTVVKEGYLLKKAGGLTGWHSRYFVLRSDRIVYYEKKPPKRDPRRTGPWFEQKAFGGKTKGEYLLGGARVARFSEREVGHPFSFGVAPKNANKMVTLRSGSQSEMEEWVMALCRVAAVSLHRVAQPLEGHTSVMEGYLRKQGGRVKGWKRRYFYLKSHALYYFSSKMDAKYLDKIPLNQGAKVVPLDPASVPNTHFPFSLQVLLKDARQYNFDAESAQIRDRWVEALNGVTDLNLMAAPMGRFVSTSTVSSSMSGASEGKEGWLKKLGGFQKWQRRYFRLSVDERTLTWFKSGTERKASGRLDLRSTVQVCADEDNTQKKSFVFSIKGGDSAMKKAARGSLKTYWLRAESQQEMESWIVAIQQSLGQKPSFRILRPTIVMSPTDASPPPPPAPSSDAPPTPTSPTSEDGPPPPPPPLSATISTSTGGTTTSSAAPTRYHSTTQPPRSTVTAMGVRAGRVKSRSLNAVRRLNTRGGRAARTKTASLSVEESDDDGTRIRLESRLESVDSEILRQPLRRVTWSPACAALFSAIRNNDLEAAKAALADPKTSVNTPMLPHKFSKSQEWPYHNTDGCQYKDTPLHVAARHRSEALVKWLLSRGADASIQNDHGHIPAAVLNFAPCKTNYGSSRADIMKLLVPGWTPKSGPSIDGKMIRSPTQDASKLSDSPVGVSREADGPSPPPARAKRDSFSSYTDDSDIAELTGKTLRRRVSNNVSEPIRKDSGDSSDVGSDAAAATASARDRNGWVDAKSLREGFMNKRGETNRNWKRRYFILGREELLYYEKKPRPSALSEGVKGSVRLLGCRVQVTSQKAQRSVSTTSLPAVRKHKKAAPRRPGRANLVKSLFLIDSAAADDSALFEFTLRPANVQRHYVLGCGDADDGNAWVNAISEQVARLERKVIRDHGSAYEGFLNTYMESKDSWTRFYFVLHGSTFSYHKTLKQKQGKPLGSIQLNRSSSVQLLANDEYECFNCFSVTGVDPGTGRTRTMVCAADCEDEVDSWASAILSSGT